MFLRFYQTVGGLLLGGYALTAFNGWEYFHSPAQAVPAEVRHAPGGLRTFHYWHSGYRGGK
jgi:hypothetical protein